jgi:SET domain-containing protein
VKAINYLHPLVMVGKTPNRGRGMFAAGPIPKGTVLETAPVIVMGADERKLLDKTLLHDYIFEWGDDRSRCCMALGYVPLYNHSYSSNCEYEMEFRKKVITVKTVRDIEKGEELFINYNGDWNNNNPIWFETKED